uniref:NR LBD domain-containing protein n=1 Tax=Panagrolaimus sp. ES5 TaxID=591445 RepID=A0AC34FZ92_9BILA
MHCQLAQNSTSTPIPTFVPQSNGIHISSGNTSPYAPPQPHHPLTGAAPINWPTPQSSLGGAAAANVSNGHNGYSLSQGAAVPSSSGLLTPHVLPNAEETFISTILNSYEQNFVKQLFERAFDENFLPGMLMNLSRNDGWSVFSSIVTEVIHYIIEFVKSVPIFAELRQENQINQLKRNTFEMCIVIMSCGYNREQDTLNIDGAFIPVRQTLQTWPSESVERLLANKIVECFQEISAFNLTPLEISLFLVIILMQSEEDQIPFTHKLETTLHNNLMQRGNETIYARLIGMLPRFRIISDDHCLCADEVDDNSIVSTAVQGISPVKLPDLYVSYFCKRLQ